MTISATSIVTGIATPGARATGTSYQGHVQYGVNSGKWWLFYLTSTNQMSALTSSDGSSWAAPTGSPFTLAAAHESKGLNYSFVQKRISSIDVLHMISQSSGNIYHSRFTLDSGPTLTTTNNEVFVYASSNQWEHGAVGCLDSSNYVWDIWQINGVDRAYYWPNADTGTSWTPGSYVYSSDAFYGNGSGILFDTGSRNLVGFGARYNATFYLTTDEIAPVYTSGTGWVIGGDIFYTLLGVDMAETNTQNMGACARSLSDIHGVVLWDNTSAYKHIRFNGTSWAIGDTIPTMALGTGSNILLLSDGTSVWMFVVDTSKMIQSIQWTSGSGWGTWSPVLSSARTNTPVYLTGNIKPDGSEIQFAWTESNSSNYDIVGATLTLGAPPAPPSTNASLMMDL